MSSPTFWTEPSRLNSRSCAALQKLSKLTTISQACRHSPCSQNGGRTKTPNAIVPVAGTVCRGHGKSRGGHCLCASSTCLQAGGMAIVCHCRTAQDYSPTFRDSCKSLELSSSCMTTNHWCLKFMYYPSEGVLCLAHDPSIPRHCVVDLLAPCLLQA